MNVSYDRQSLVNGQKLRNKTEESPGTLATYNGVDMSSGGGNGLAANNETRMAGPGGVHAMRLKTDPEYAMKTAEWEGLFGQSNQGADFNATKRAAAQAQAELNITNQQLGRRA
jgi:hypothetical protein